MRLRIPADQIASTAAPYLCPREEHDLLTRRDRIQARGHLTMEDLRDAAHWKSPRITKAVDRNDEQYIQEITGFACLKLVTVTRRAQDQSVSQTQADVTRPASDTQFSHDLNGSRALHGTAWRDSRPDRGERAERLKGASTSMLGLSGWTFTWNDESRVLPQTAGRDGRPDRGERAERLKEATTPRLVAAERDGVKTEYVYDYMGRRRTRTLSVWDDPAQVWQQTAETEFIWDGPSSPVEACAVAGWPLLLVERITVSGGETLTRTYICGLDLSGQLGGEGTNAMSTAGGIAGILAVTSTSSSSSSSAAALFFDDGSRAQRDGRRVRSACRSEASGERQLAGNVINLLNTGTAATVATYEYSPFGRTVAAHGPLADANPVRFSTKYAEDMELPDLPPGPELYYYGRRYYSPELGRWANRDPIGEKGGTNLLRGMQNCHTRYCDPIGLKCCCCCVTNVSASASRPDPRVEKVKGGAFGQNAMIDAWIFRPLLKLSIKINYIETNPDGDRFAGCRYDWWEKADFFSDKLKANGRGCKDGSWCNVTDLYRDGIIDNRSAGFPNEFFRNEPPSPCETEEGGIDISDADSMRVAHPKGAAGHDFNRIEFKIIVRSGSRCATECGKKQGQTTSWQVTGKIMFSIDGHGNADYEWDPKLEAKEWDGKHPR